MHFAVSVSNSCSFPFDAQTKASDFFEIVAVDKRLLADIIRRDQAFWGQWGFVPESNLAVVLAITEFEEKLDRYRAYGYLFGYPEYAVTFFVEAAREQDSTKNLCRAIFFKSLPIQLNKGDLFMQFQKGIRQAQLTLHCIEKQRKF